MATISKQNSKTSSFGATLLIALLNAYRLLLSPILGPRCRFYPSCSSYALEAIELHGALKGSIMMLKRLARCHPLCEGGFDPVPPSSANHTSHKV